jgi:hypothetical protein
MKEKFVDISHNVSLLMETLASKIRSLGEAGVSNLKIISKGKLGENKD